MCWQTQSITIFLAEKLSVFSLTQFPQYYFISMTSQAGVAGSQPSDTLHACPGMRWAAPVAPPAGQCYREELHGDAGGKALPSPCPVLLPLLTHSPCHWAGAGLEMVAMALWWCWDATVPCKQRQSCPGATTAVVISQSLDFSSTNISFSGVAITTGINSLLTSPRCTNCTISCHCYMPVISFEGLKLLSATFSAPLLPPWA